MIQRIVLLKLDGPSSNPEARAEIARYSREVLASLPGVQQVQVGVAADEASLRAWDISLVVSFDDLDAVTAYLPHPDHRRYVDEYLRPRLEIVKAWNFEV